MDLSEAAADAERWGLPAEIGRALDASEPEGFKVWPDNMAIVDAWLIVSSQWRALGQANGHVLWIGLDYAGARAGLDGAAVTLAPGQWAGLRLMERTAAAALNGSRG